MGAELDERTGGAHNGRLVERRALAVLRPGHEAAVFGRPRRREHPLLRARRERRAGVLLGPVPVVGAAARARAHAEARHPLHALRDRALLQAARHRQPLRARRHHLPATQRHHLPGGSHSNPQFLCKCTVLYCTILVSTVHVYEYTRNARMFVIDYYGYLTSASAGHIPRHCVQRAGTERRRVAEWSDTRAAQHVVARFDGRRAQLAGGHFAGLPRSAVPVRAAAV